VVTLDGTYYQVKDCPLLPSRKAPPSETANADPAAMRILVGARGERMLRLVARWADAWNTAWYAGPDERYGQARDALRAACDAEGRDPAEVEVTVGMLIGDGERRTPREPAAVADALAAWRDAGVAHLICWVDPSDAAGIDVLTEGTRRFRG
jgi:alkanesulfonate monooxygenase SsuD/methylene tetrahydromethanopterin reductase-like flavin-dependent oxidoreductase (luciferase family)